MATAVRSARLHFGQGVTGRPPWSLGLGMAGLHPHGMCQLSHEDSRQVAGAPRASCQAEVVGSDPFRQPVRGLTPSRRGASILGSGAVGTRGGRRVFGIKMALFEVQMAGVPGRSGIRNRLRSTYWLAVSEGPSQCFNGSRDSGLGKGYVQNGESTNLAASARGGRITCNVHRR